LSQKKKIAIVITRMDLGGAQEVALETASGLDPERFDVTLISGPGGMLDSEARRRLGERFVHLGSLKHPISPFDDLKAFFWLSAYFFRERTDLVHTHSSKAGFLGRLAAWTAGVPSVLHTVHGWSFNDRMRNPLRWIYIHLERVLALLSDALCVVALSCRDKGLFNGVGRPRQYRLLRAGVDLEAWRALLPTAHEGLVVGCIANCKEQKNPLDFVRVAALALKREPELQFVYLGDGPLRKEAEALAQSLGVADHVNFKGWVEDPKELARGFDLFLLSSLWEGLPCVFAQVLSMGIPVVATDVDGASEIIHEGINGYLCQAGDVEALADRVSVLASDAGLRSRMSGAAKNVDPEFDFQDMIKKTEAIYESF
jgi:glycosyltransferase involved in cell wall biosynthesis